MGYQGFPLSVQIEQDVILHAADIGDLTDGDVAPLTIDPDEQGGGGWGLGDGWWVLGDG